MNNIQKALYWACMAAAFFFFFFFPFFIGAGPWLPTLYSIESASGSDSCLAYATSSRSLPI
jgi:hypothetical protein